MTRGLWDRYREYLSVHPSIGLSVDVSRMKLGTDFFATMDRMKVCFCDNTDPDGFDRVLARLDGHLDETLTIVISKSGGTKETRNGMLEAQAAYERAGLDFGKHAVAVTGLGSELDRYATDHGFVARFPMWDWVGGRTSELSAVGLLPAALQGLDVQSILDGARACVDIQRR